MFPNTSDEEAQSIVFLWRLINFSKNFRYCIVAKRPLLFLKQLFTSNVNFDPFFYFRPKVFTCCHGGWRGQTVFRLRKRASPWSSGTGRHSWQTLQPLVIILSNFEIQFLFTLNDECSGEWSIVLSKVSKLSIWF